MPELSDGLVVLFLLLIRIACDLGYWGILWMALWGAQQMTVQFKVDGWGPRMLHELHQAAVLVSYVILLYLGGHDLLAIIRGPDDDA